MRIIAGLAKGMTLDAPRSGTRPTADRIREAIFSSLGERVIEARAMDLFAGTGALGLEAASRGAAAVTFVENARGALDSLQKNITAFRRNRGIECELMVTRASVAGELRRLAGEEERYTIIFADPPYGNAAQTLLDDENLPRLLAEDGLLVLESAKREALNVKAPWEVTRQAEYGDTRVSFLRRVRSA